MSRIDSDPEVSRGVRLVALHSIRKATGHGGENLQIRVIAATVLVWGLWVHKSTISGFSPFIEV